MGALAPVGWFCAVAQAKLEDSIPNKELMPTRMLHHGLLSFGLWFLGWTANERVTLALRRGRNLWHSISTHY